MKYFLLLILSACSTILPAQKAGLRWLQTGVSAGVGEKAASSSLAIVHSYALFDKVAVGYGLRAGMMSLRNQPGFESASQKPMYLFSSLSQDNSHYALNLMMQVSYSPVRRLSLGFNLDLIGLGFGYSEARRTPTPQTEAEWLSPRERGISFNRLVGYGMDMGQLNSEFFAACDVSKRLTLSAGLSQQFLAITVKNGSATPQLYPSAVNEVKAYRYFYVGFVNLSYRLWARARKAEGTATSHLSPVPVTAF